LRRGLQLIWVLAVAVAASACGGGASVSSPRSVTIGIHHSHFTPASFSVAAGTTVRIVVRNTDPIDHELIVGDRTTQDRHEGGVDAHHDGSVPGEVSVPAGKVIVTTYHFDQPGQFFYGCHLPGHWAYGMHGVVTARSAS
jgi:uncharacterized cupredoxin-like copper-binding protein